MSLDPDKLMDIYIHIYIQSTFQKRKVNFAPALRLNVRSKYDISKSNIRRQGILKRSPCDIKKLPRSQGVGILLAGRF